MRKRLFSRPHHLASSQKFLAPVLTALLAVSAGAASNPAVSGGSGLNWHPTNASDTLGGYFQQRLVLSSNRPVSIKKVPTDLSAPSYGELKIGPREQPGERPLVVDEPQGTAPRFFFDGNGNGDLTDDPPVAWTQKSVSGQGGPVTVYRGESMVKIPYATGARDGRLGFFRMDRQSAKPGQNTNELFYYRDYLMQGRLMLGDKSYQAALVDEFATGDFRGQDNTQFSGVRLLMDLNGDSRYDLQRESLDVRKPFNVGGTTWEFGNMTAEGKFEFVRSSRTAPEIHIPPNLARGAKVPAFTAKTTSGQTVNFPGDYKGKVVLLDFWATWCGPCLMEIPNVVANYTNYHERGFEILGISLDKAEVVATLGTFTKQKNMPWPQICDGKMWESELAQRYGVQGIPLMLLVDGDSGEILGSMLEVRAAKLGPAIEAGLARKQAPK